MLTVTKGWSEAYGLFLQGEAPLVLNYTTSPAYHAIAEGEAGLDAAGEYALLRTHDGDGNPARHRGLRLYRGLLELLAAAWALAEQRAGNAAINFGDYARQRLWQAERAFRSYNE